MLIDLCALAAFTYFHYPDNRLLRINADMGEKDAEYQLARAYEYGDGVPQNYLIAKKLA